nr:MAG TPA: hypothetical protein [Caudoviricetes sp.]
MNIFILIIRCTFIYKIRSINISLTTIRSSTFYT